MKKKQKNIFYLAIIATAILSINDILAAETETIIASDITSTAAKDAIKEFLGAAKETAQVVTVPLIYIKFGVELYSLAKATKSYLSPSTQEQESAKQAERDIKLLQSHNEFRNCMVQNRNNSSVNDSGLPTTCEKAAYMLAYLAGQDEVERIARVVNKYKNKKEFN